ncbi:hypothetical protein [uncultured Tateyamaria sp.]|uniref:hypothetical protein n=1 Tax=uncultured Tateyamaria sp. TaxID=455651 RepID=UPI00261D5970|nr:hypothetical protein [uncultured Tateyamaria sp.]
MRRSAGVGWTPGQQARGSPPPTAAPPTLETFLRRNKPSQPGPGQTEGIPHMDDDEIARRITVLE